MTFDDTEGAPASTTPNRDARLAAAPVGSSDRPGTFRVKGRSAHHRTHPRAADGTLPEPTIVQPGRTFQCDGAEALACRQDPDKFEEVV